MLKGLISYFNSLRLGELASRRVDKQANGLVGKLKSGRVGEL